MFFDYIDNLRRLPSARKQLMAMILAGGITAGIFVVWLHGMVTVLPSSDSLSVQSAAAGESLSVESVATVGGGNSSSVEVTSVSPFVTIRDAIFGMINEIKLKIDELPNLGKISVDNSVPVVVDSASGATSTFSSPMDRNIESNTVVSP